MLQYRFSCPHCPYTCNWVADLQKHSKGQVARKEQEGIIIFVPRVHVEVLVVLSLPTLEKPVWWNHNLMALNQNSLIMNPSPMTTI